LGKKEPVVKGLKLHGSYTVGSPVYNVQFAWTCIWKWKLVTSK
jgi:hypothetical protein